MDYISPIGVLRIETTEKGLRAIRYLSQEQEADNTLEFPQSEYARNCMALCVSALNSYFAKQWGVFSQLRSKIPLDINGTDFQKRVWGIIYSLPNTYPIVGIHYSELAYLSGKPDATRACARICGQNAIPIIIPCHRITAVNGLGGYAGGISKKSWLLWHEGITKGSKTNFYSSNPPQTR